MCQKTGYFKFNIDTAVAVFVALNLTCSNLFVRHLYRYHFDGDGHQTEFCYNWGAFTWLQKIDLQTSPPFLRRLACRSIAVVRYRRGSNSQQPRLAVLAAAPLFLTFFNAVHSVFVKERHDRSFVEGAYFWSVEQHNRWFLKHTLLVYTFISKEEQSA